MLSVPLLASLTHLLRLIIVLIKIRLLAENTLSYAAVVVVSPSSAAKLCDTVFNLFVGIVQRGFLLLLQQVNAWRNLVVLILLALLNVRPLTGLSIAKRLTPLFLLLPLLAVLMVLLRVE